MIAVRSALVWLRAPGPMAAMIGAFVLALAGSLRLGGVTGHFGVLTTMEYDADATITYGLGAALISAGLAASAVSRLDEVLHGAGLDPFQRMARGLLVGGACGIAARLAAAAGALVAGLINTFATSGDEIDASGGDFLLAEGRLLATFLLTGLTGAAIGLLVRRGFTVAAITTALVVPYLPAVGALANRAAAALDVLPYLPFGALRATLSGNGGIFGQDSGQRRLVDPRLGAAVAVTWFLVVLAAAAARRARLSLSPDETFKTRAYVAGGLVAALAAGAVLTPGHIVPWQWQPAWRHAREAGWSSDKVALRWAEAVRTGDPAIAALYAAGAYHPIDATTAEPLRHAASVRVSDVNTIADPGLLTVYVTLSDPIVSGNVEVTEVAVQLTFTDVDNRYLIRTVSEPAPSLAHLES